MRYLASSLVICTTLLLSGNAQAEDSATPTASEATAALPEITIVRRDGGSIEEYRLGERIFMVKLSPAKGPAYYLVDTDGDGKLNTRYNAMDDGLVIPSWVLQ